MGDLPSPEDFPRAWRQAQGTKCRKTQFAVLWVLNNRFVTGVVAGPRTPEQLEDYLGCFKHQFTKDDEALIDAMVVTGHSTTPGYNDPAYPIEGRRVR